MILALIALGVGVAIGVQVGWFLALRRVHLALDDCEHRLGCLEEDVRRVPEYPGTVRRA